MPKFSLASKGVQHLQFASLSYRDSEFQGRTDLWHSYLSIFSYRLSFDVIISVKETGYVFELPPAGTRNDRCIHECGTSSRQTSVRNCHTVAPAINSHRNLNLIIPVVVQKRRGFATVARIDLHAKMRLPIRGPLVVSLVNLSSRHDRIFYHVHRDEIWIVLLVPPMYRLVFEKYSRYFVAFCGKNTLSSYQRNSPSSSPHLRHSYRNSVIDWAR